MTKDADKMICCIYKEYLQRRKLGNSIAESSLFSSEYFKNDPVLSKWHPDDCTEIARELKKMGFLDIWVSGKFILTSEAITYMENRFKNGIVELTDFISKLIP
ncbi:hypothetical protein FYJ45_24625 [Eisenbergiella tayi]|uniref:YjcQ protein n=1 Tax=Eisenbergiella porci TaxID=2652274 RepID=A0A6N7WNN9_9FIRM|nr:hypothetical protein [Eisenbergiella porci]MSS91304.1 hypothetical protein [Eisenbergiella porci]